MASLGLHSLQIFYILFLNCAFSTSQVIAEHLSVEEVAGIKEGFKLMDIGNKGKIDMNELKVGLQKLGHQVPDTDVQILMDAVSVNFFQNHYSF